MERDDVLGSNRVAADGTVGSVKLVAEIGGNHLGEMEIARRLIGAAAACQHVHIAKFQKRNPRALLSQEQYNSPHPNPEHSFGKTYGAHREFLEFDLDQHRQLKAWCEKSGIEYSVSVWDITSAREIVTLNPAMVKVPSACNLNFEILDYLCRYYEGKIHISLGMTTKSEELSILRNLADHGRTRDVVLYACTSAYPTPFEDACLREIDRLISAYGDDVHAVGFSGHHVGIALDIAALTLGAAYIERHFTLDRGFKGTDHAASLEPDEFGKLARDLVAVDAALTLKPSDILPVEIPACEKLKIRA
ncbi:MAG: N-acetylneuraminate synthase [Acidimicrobiaceae bacterium]|nr:N-acetylneuraminate synthase [Acidimicrobiaceae bacterium]